MARIASLRLTNAARARSAALLATLVAGCPAQRPADGLQTSPAVQSAVPSASSHPLALPALKRCARSLKLLFPNETAATVAADPTVPYRLLIQTLDALRADDQSELFPEFNIAVTAASASSK